MIGGAPPLSERLRRFIEKALNCLKFQYLDVNKTTNMINTCSYKLKASELWIQNLVDRITKMAGMNHKIEVFEAPYHPNACATLVKNCSLEPKKPIISYNPSYLLNKNYWEIVAIMAHEVGHHFNNDLHGKYTAGLLGIPIDKNSHRKELNADRFAGWVLKNEGASLNDSIQLYNSPEFNHSYSHPGREKRKQAMMEGWLEAYNKSTPPKKVEAPKPQNDLAQALLGAAAITLLIAGIGSLANRR